MAIKRGGRVNLLQEDSVRKKSFKKAVLPFVHHSVASFRSPQKHLPVSRSQKPGAWHWGWQTGPAKETKRDWRNLVGIAMNESRSTITTPTTPTSRTIV